MNLNEDLPSEEIFIIMEKGRHIALDGSSVHRGGTRIVLYTLDGIYISLFFKLDFPCFKNKAKYEALIMG